MRIPLDYYRILSVPIKATISQLEQAYGDRLLQQPRREYNEKAIEARQALIQHAYQVLSDERQRADYDAQFFVNMQPVEVSTLPETITETEGDINTELTSGESFIAASSSEAIEATKELLVPDTSLPVPTVAPTIEIPSAQLIGALLILHELGEYELALQLGVDYFNSPEFSCETDNLRTDAQENIILSVTLAYMELGREQWHRREYENAAISGQMGINLLNRESLFPQIKEELQLDLYKLRPYRVLELISQNKEGSKARKQGFQLLGEMLVQRQGIEGKGEDRSGLGFDQFLCFVQQLRTYLTSQEQQELFDNDSQSKSAIANYLAVYALLGRGFNLKQPELILRAQRKLDYLSEKQDVAWEQAVVELLLGHTEKAISKLQSSHDLSKLEQVQRHSDLNTDLLPGMCIYGEKWLQEDVIAQFADLTDIRLTLKEYFADSQVQKYLEDLAFIKTSSTINFATTVPKQQNIAVSTAEPVKTEEGIFSRWRKLFMSEKEDLVSKKVESQARSERELVGAGIAVSNQLNSQQSGVKINPAKTYQKKQKPKYRQTVVKNSSTNFRYPHASPTKSLSLPLETKNRAVPPSVIQKAQGKARQKRVARKRKLSAATRRKGWFFILSLLLGTSMVGFMAMRLFLTPKNKIAHQDELAVSISQATVELPTVEPKVAPQPKLTFIDKSEQIIQKWLTSKSASFGKEHKIEQLNEILAEPLLATWRDRAIAHQQGNSYREYDHKVIMKSAKVDDNNPNKAVVEAEIKEIAKHYQGGQLDSNQSYDDNLLVRYQLILQGENWLIQNTEVLKTL